MKGTIGGDEIYLYKSARNWWL